MYCITTGCIFSPHLIALPYHGVYIQSSSHCTTLPRGVYSVLISLYCITMGCIFSPHLIALHYHGVCNQSSSHCTALPRVYIQSSSHSTALPWGVYSVLISLYCITMGCIFSPHLIVLHYHGVYIQSSSHCTTLPRGVYSVLISFYYITMGCIFSPHHCTALPWGVYSVPISLYCITTGCVISPHRIVLCYHWLCSSRVNKTMLLHITLRMYLLQIKLLLI